MKALLKIQEGFTLIELLAVMAIVATLAGIIATQVSGSGDTSKDVQTKQDATTVGTAVADYFSDREGASIVIPKPVTVFDEDGNIISTDSKWPGFIDAGETVVLLNTGSGYKYMHLVENIPNP